MSVGLDMLLTCFESGWLWSLSRTSPQIAAGKLCAAPKSVLCGCLGGRRARPEQQLTTVRTFVFETITNMGFRLRLMSAIRSPRSGWAEFVEVGRVGDSSSTP